MSGNFSGAGGAELTGDGPANAGEGAGIANLAKLTITGSMLSSNSGGTASGLGSDGGGLYNTGSATISSSDFTGNVDGTGGTRSGYGGAIANLGTLALTNSTLSGNLAATGAAGNPGVPGGNGGGLYQGAARPRSRATPSLPTRAATEDPASSASPVSHTAAPAGRGGLYSTATLSITNSTLSGNYVGVGGANAPPLGGSGPPGIGGGIAVGAATTNVLYSTITENSDGIDAPAGAITLGGTIVADSTGANDLTGANCTGTVTETTGFNLDSGTTCNFALPTDLVGTEPLLSPLAANGGPTQTQALTSASPAIDHGGVAANGCPATDQRGMTRPDETTDSGSCDIGAYESQGLA